MPQDTVEKLKTFLTFCQEVASKEKNPYWGRNLAKFDRVFRNNQANFSKPIVSFINTYRPMLEAPIVENEDSNDKWLRIDEDIPIPVMKKGWVAAHPRGIIIPIKPDGEKNHEYSLPLSEIYQCCIDTKVDIMETTAETVPAKFFELFFEMLSEVEPDNVHFKQNAEKASDSVEKSKTSVGDLAGILSTGMSAFVPQIGGLLNSFMSNFDEKTKESVREVVDGILKGDVSALTSKLDPELISSATQQLEKGFSAIKDNTITTTESTPLLTQEDASEQD